MLICLDTNVYSRPFDDQSQPQIEQEANAFLEIIARVNSGNLTLLCSDILRFEVHNISNLEKRTRLEVYFSLCHKFIGNSEEVLALGRDVQTKCHIRARDALHIASAILGDADYFLSCDKKVTQLNQAHCYRILSRRYHKPSFSAMNPVLFVEKLTKGELK